MSAGKKQGKRGGMVFQDSDAYKWLEAVAYTLECCPDPQLQANADKLVDIIAAAQEDDGYLNTYFQVNEPDRKYQSLYMSHELYCAGHFIEAAVAYYQATHNQKVLTIATRLADNMFADYAFNILLFALYAAYLVRRERIDVRALLRSVLKRGGV